MAKCTTLMTVDEEVAVSTGLWFLGCDYCCGCYWSIPLAPADGSGEILPDGHRGYCFVAKPLRVAYGPTASL